MGQFRVSEREIVGFWRQLRAVREPVAACSPQNGKDRTRVYLQSPLGTAFCCQVQSYTAIRIRVMVGKDL